ncbi:MAG: ribonuclease P protein component [bacterium]|nr:ribonuclease P protein component [bacterium]
MLPVKNRLTKRTDFVNVYRKGAFFSEGPLSLKSTPNSLKYARIGFSIEKKFFKKAVERNRIKRLLREAFHQNLENIKKSVDMVVFYKKSEKNPDFKAIFGLVKKIIKRIK